MAINTNYRVVLQQAYAYGSTTPYNDTFEKPKNQIKRKRRMKVTRGKGGDLRVKVFTTIFAKPTWSTKRNTTSQAAIRTIYGRVAGAAEAQQQWRADLLRYIYDPLCPGPVALRAFWDLVCRINRYTMRLTARQQYRVCCIVPMVIRDQVQVYRGGARLTNDAALSRAMGVRQDHYKDHWERHVLTMRSIIDGSEYAASVPVRDIVNAFHEEVLTETGI